MPEAGIYLVAALGVVLVLVRPLKVAFAALVAYWLFVPASLIVPGGPHILLVDRLVLYTFALRLVIGASRHRPDDPVSPRSVRPSAFRISGVHLAMVGVLVAGFLDGVVLASRGATLASDLDTWIYSLDMAVVFVTVLAVVRTLGQWTVVRTVVAGLSATVVFAVLERLTGSGWSHFLFEHVPTSYLAPGADPLGVRDGHVRAQVASQFSLEYAWVLAMFLPVALVAALRWASPRLRLRFRRLAYLVPVALVGGVVLTSSRSAEVGLAAAAILVVLATGAPRRLTTSVGAGLLLLLLVAVADGSLIGSPFSAAAHTDSISVRLHRLPTLFALVVHRPFIGLGYSGLFGSLPGLDNAYALLYGTIGVIGLAAWGVMLVTTGATVTRSLRARVGSDTRDLGAACVVGIVAVVVAGAAYDLVATPQSQWGFMILAALGVGVAEAAPRRAPARRWWAARAALPVAGVLGGFVLLAAAPMSSAQSAAVFMTTPDVIASSPAPVEDYTGKVLVNSLCGFLTGPGEVLPSTTLTCSRLTDVSPSVWPMLALVRITGPNPAAVRAEYAHTLGRLGSVLPAEITPVGAGESGKPAWATTAPVWVGLVGLVSMFLIPPITRRAWRPRRDAGRHPSQGTDREVPLHNGHAPGPPGTDDAPRPPQRVGEGAHLVSVAQSAGDGANTVVPHEGPDSAPAVR